MFAFKEPGIGANKTTKREFVFDIPLTIKEDLIEVKKTEKVKKLHLNIEDDELIGLGAIPLPGSWLGKVF